MTMLPTLTSHSPADIVYQMATERDLPQIMEILNREIETGVNCFRTQAMSALDQAQWWRARENGRYPAWVARHNVTEYTSKVVGWASISRWSTYEAYDATAEISVWILPEYHRQGIGSQLFRMVIDFARGSNFRVILSRIESENAGSLALHRRFGFTEVGTMHNVGEKFGQLLHVALLQLQLHSPPPV